MSDESVILRDDAQPHTALELRSQVNLIQEVMREVMQENVHYGKIPGTPKPSLWKPGAEKLGFTFHIAVDVQVDADLSTAEAIRYRIRAVATHQGTGTFLGASLGECSSDEEKYRWRAAVCQQEFDETPIDRRRTKWKKGSPNPYVIHQVRTEPADIANTVLKIAGKRAEVAVILKVTAASDCFTQDIEDLPDYAQEGAATEQAAKPESPAPAPAAEKTAGAATPRPAGDPISEAQAKRFYAIARGKGWTETQRSALLKRYGFTFDREITKNLYDKVCAELEKTNDVNGTVPAGFK